MTARNGAIHFISYDFIFELLGRFSIVAVFFYLSFKIIEFFFSLVYFNFCCFLYLYFGILFLTFTIIICLFVGPFLIAAILIFKG